MADFISFPSETKEDSFDVRPQIGDGRTPLKVVYLLDVLFWSVSVGNRGEHRFKSLISLPSFLTSVFSSWFSVTIWRNQLSIRASLRMTGLMLAIREEREARGENNGLERRVVETQWWRGASWGLDGREGLRGDWVVGQREDVSFHEDVFTLHALRFRFEQYPRTRKTFVPLPRNDHVDSTQRPFHRPNPI